MFHTGWLLSFVLNPVSKISKELRYTFQKYGQYILRPNSVIVELCGVGLGQL